MIWVFHPGIRGDVRQILDYYDSRSDLAGDRFLEEFNSRLDEVRANPGRFRYLDDRRQRCNLRRFPYHFVFDRLNEMTLRVLVLRHDKRHPGFGMRRR